MLKNSRKIFAAIALVSCMAGFMLCRTVCAEENDSGVVYIQPVAEKGFVSDGHNVVLTNGQWDQFTVNLKASGIEKFAEENNGCGINNYTLFLTYNPNVVRITGVTSPSETEIRARYVYCESNGKTSTLYNSNNISDSIYYAPSASNSQYADVGADGMKNCGELGKVKLAYVLRDTDVDGKLLTATNDGTLVGFTFRAVGEGDAEISIDICSYAKGFSPAPYSESEMTTVAVDGNIYVRDISKGGKTGDLDYDGKVTKEDAQLLMKYVAKTQELSWHQLQYADITGSGVDIRDVIALLKMCS